MSHPEKFPSGVAPVEKTDAPSIETASLALRWGVHQRTVQRWVRRHGPMVVADEARLAVALLSDAKCAPAVRAKASQVVARETIRQPVIDATLDPAATASDLRGRLQLLDEHLAWISDKLNAAKAPGGSAADIITYSRMFREFQSSAIQNELAQQRLGIDGGQLISRTEFERIIRAIASRLGLGIQRTRDGLASKLLRLDREEEAANVLEPAFISAGLIAPFADAADQAVGCGLPGWVVDAFRSAIGDNIEQGEAHFNAARQVKSDGSGGPATS